MTLNRNLLNYCNHIRYQGADLHIDYEWARIKYNDLDSSERLYKFSSLRYTPQANGYLDHTFQYVRCKRSWQTKRLQAMPSIRSNDVNKIIRQVTVDIRYGVPQIYFEINKNELSNRFFKPYNSSHTITTRMWNIIYHVAQKEMLSRVNLSHLLSENSVKYNKYTDFSIKPLSCDLDLGKYQLENIKWMLEIENRVPARIAYTKAYRFGKYYVDPFSKQKFKEKPPSTYIELMGGALLDEMGLGKTIVMLISALLNPATFDIGTPDRYVYPQFKDPCPALITSKNSKMYGKKCGAKIKEPLEIYCKKHRKKNPDSQLSAPVANIRIDNSYYTIADCKKLLKSRATLIICPNTVPDHWAKQCLEHITRKTDIKILKVTCAKEYQAINYRDLINADFVIASFDFIARNPSFKEINNTNMATTLYQSPAYFGNLFWHRVIVDEIHEILDEKYKKSRLLQFIMAVKSRFRWCLSGSAFTRDHKAYRTVVDFLMKGHSSDIFPYLERYHHKNLIREYFRRNTFQSTCDEKVTEIPPVVYKEIWLNFSSTEKAMYNTRLLTSQKRGEPKTDEYLRQLCCHPQLSAENKELLQGCGSLKQIHESMKEQTQKYIENTKNEIIHLEDRLEYLSQFLDSKQKSILPVYIHQEDCPDYLTMNRTTKGALTRKRKQLDNLRKALAFYADPKGNDQPKSMLENLNAIDDSDDLEYLIHLYGTKMGHLIHYFKNDFQENSKDCAIIFSQWDTLLKNIQITLKQNGIQSICCKGNVFQKRKAIERFKEKAKGVRILLLSTKYAASGLDLMEANKIILFDPVYGTEKYKHGIEAQAIGRAARLGQERVIEVIRFLVRNTIEEEIHYSMLPKEKIKNVKVI